MIPALCQALVFGIQYSKRYARELCEGLLRPIVGLLAQKTEAKAACSVLNRMARLGCRCRTGVLETAPSHRRTFTT